MVLGVVGSRLGSVLQAWAQCVPSHLWKVSTLQGKPRALVYRPFQVRAHGSWDPQTQDERYLCPCPTQVYLSEGEESPSPKTLDSQESLLSTIATPSFPGLGSIPPLYHPSHNLKCWKQMKPDTYFLSLHLLQC